MKTIIHSLVLLASLGLTVTTSVRAAEPPKGRVLILKNEHTLEGDVERVGDRYRVRRSAGETWVPCTEVAGVAASLPDAYSFLRTRANGDDADERLRLANWCRLHGLREQALAELRAAAQLRPDHGPTKRLMQYLQQEALKPAAPNPAAPIANRAKDEPMPPVEVTTECLGLFATRVQPILMNTCARCHATGNGGKFRLTQVYNDSLGDRRTLERNLAAVLAEINLSQPEASRLLTKSISDHAHTGQAPIKNRKDAPYRTLEKWVRLTVENNPQLRDATPATAKTVAAPAEARPSVPEPPTAFGADGRTPASTGAPAQPGPTSLPVQVSKTSPAPPPPPPPVTPADPYDPEPFNRQAHPEAGKPAPGK